MHGPLKPPNVDMNIPCLHRHGVSGLGQASSALTILQEELLGRPRLATQMSTCMGQNWLAEAPDENTMVADDHIFQHGRSENSVFNAQLLSGLPHCQTRTQRLLSIS